MPADARDLMAGRMYRIARDGRQLANLYRYEGKCKPIYCSLHGEYIGEEYLFTKRRHSEVRPWSENHWFRLENWTFEEVMQ